MNETGQQRDRVLVHQNKLATFNAKNKTGREECKHGPWVFFPRIDLNWQIQTINKHKHAHQKWFRTFHFNIAFRFFNILKPVTHDQRWKGSPQAVPLVIYGESSSAQLRRIATLGVTHRSKMPQSDALKANFYQFWPQLLLIFHNHNQWDYSCVCVHG